MKRTAIGLIALGLAVGIFLPGAGAQEKKKRGTFTIGKETTFVTGPLDADGHIDYVAALNERLAKGVTAENNAVVLLMRAFGPQPEGAKLRPEFFERLKMTAPPEQGAYFVPLANFARNQLQLSPGPQFDQLMKRFESAGKQPWKETEHPELAAWLKANEQPLAVVMEATKRSHYYHPLVSSGGLIGALLPAVQKCREVGSALCARAMLQAGQGKIEQAWQDLQACHRLARLVGQGSTLIEALVGYSLDQIAFKADIAFLNQVHPTANQLDAFLKDLQKLPPHAALADKINLCERYSTLEHSMLIDRHGIKYLEGLSNGNAKQNTPLQEQALAGINWDPALKLSNEFYDRFAAALREKDRAAREKKLSDIELDVKDLKKRLVQDGEVNLLLAGDAKQRGTAIGQILICLMLPAMTRVQGAADRARQVHDNVIIAFALARCQREHGEYPKELAALSPKYLPAIPQDLFSGKPLIYRPQGKGFLLYSVGPNGQDEGGRGPEDKPAGDDLSVRIPVAAK